MDITSKSGNVGKIIDAADGATVNFSFVEVNALEDLADAAKTVSNAKKTIEEREKAMDAAAKKMDEANDAMSDASDQLKKNLANKIFGYFARCEENFRTTTLLF